MGRPASARRGKLQAGAARVDITPPEDASLPMSGYGSRTEGFTGIHDRLHARALAVGDGSGEGAIVVLDLSAVPDDFWERTVPRITQATRIPSEHILLAATHTHAGPTIRLTEQSSAKQRAYVADLENKVVEAVAAARRAMRPARIGFGSGTVNVNVNRRARMQDGSWWLGRNPDGASDKTLAVVKIESAAGEPIAILMNYAVHCVVLGPRNLKISADLAGGASRFVEEHYGDRVVAPWTSGAAGDQNPIYHPHETTAEALMLGRMIGEEALRAAANLRMTDAALIRGAQKVISCPGKKHPPGPLRQWTRDYRPEDADPVSIRLSLLMLNHLAIAGVSGEVLTAIGTRLKKESPFVQTMMVTHCNGWSGYIPDDEAYKNVSYEIVTTRLKPGCAENGVVGGLLEMMDMM